MNLFYFSRVGSFPTTTIIQITKIYENIRSKEVHVDPIKARQIDLRVGVNEEKKATAENKSSSSLEHGALRGEVKKTRDYPK